MFNRLFLIATVLGTSTFALADNKIHQNSSIQDEVRAPARVAPAINVEQLFNDSSIVRDDGQRIRIESWRPDDRGIVVVGRNSAGELNIVQVPPMEVGGYANFFGALFVFDGSGFQKLTRQNAHEFTLVKRYHAGVAD